MISLLSLSVFRVLALPHMLQVWSTQHLPGATSPGWGEAMWNHFYWNDMLHHTYLLLILSGLCRDISVSWCCWFANYLFYWDISMQYCFESAPLLFSYFLPSLLFADLFFSTPFTDNRKNTTMKIVVKGVMTVEDALASVRHGVDGIWVSNHGARQLDTTPATIEVFNYVCKSVCLSGYSPYISTFSTLFFHFFC